MKNNEPSLNLPQQNISSVKFLYARNDNSTQAEPNSTGKFAKNPCQTGKQPFLTLILPMILRCLRHGLGATAPVVTSAANQACVTKSFPPKSFPALFQVSALPSGCWIGMRLVPMLALLCSLVIGNILECSWSDWLYWIEAALLSRTFLLHPSLFWFPALDFWYSFKSTHCFLGEVTWNRYLYRGVCESTIGNMFFVWSD